MTRCSDCQLEKPEHEFSYRKLSRNKKQPRCKTCSNARVRRWAKRNRKVVTIPAGQLSLFL